MAIANLTAVLKRVTERNFEALGCFLFIYLLFFIRELPSYTHRKLKEKIPPFLVQHSSGHGCGVGP